MLLHPVRDVLWVAAVIVVFLSSCHRNDDPLIGRWTVEKVNVEFDENKATPEMVRQYGGMEKDNYLEISKDSLLSFVTGGDTLRGKCSLRGESIYCDGSFLGKFKDGAITTETLTPLGKVMVSYKKGQ